MRTSRSIALMGLPVVLEVVVLALPGEPTVETGGYVLCAVLLVLAGPASARRWALVLLTIMEGFLAAGGIVAALGPTRNLELGLFAVLAVFTTFLGVVQLRSPRGPAAAG